MSYPSDDLVPLLVPQPTAGVQLRQGIVRAWDPTTAQSTVEVDGVNVTDLPVLNTTEVLVLAPGDTVAILTTGQAASSWAILGRLTIPGSPAAASALDAIRTTSETVAAYETTSSSTWGDLATPGPVVSDVLIGPSGRCLVLITSTITMLVAAGGGEMAYEISGATTVPTGDTPPSLAYYGPAGSGPTATRLVLHEGLNPGLHTFTARYVSEMDPGGEARFGGRNLTVIPL
ncbi:hypothetical protein [Micromonospora inyonensis]|uniref:Minor tail protein n=1 Tax=Micromonospora inyonensis TaxID=47866 RepID=A0A1C6RXH7_9ACTN|nr:hypothetical protein [Micromonospora inyonensis]SCL21505.1 hypothetical protein GA0074694_3055 [Micromonospora inyonensis]SCL21731.1 hypothetical protein GA0074694_3127 [Micromonospora inyonensis]